MQSPGFDHLGLLLENRDEVDAVLEKSKKWQDRDSRVQIQLYDDLVNSDHTTHAFYVKHLLPIWFDVQNQEYANGTDPMREWHFG